MQEANTPNTNAPAANRDTYETRCFPLGRVAATPGALDLLDRTGCNSLDLLIRHTSGDWGDLPPEDIQANEEAITQGFRIMSSYHLNARERLWIITEADRSVTTLLLPSEY